MSDQPQYDPSGSGGAPPPPPGYGPPGGGGGYGGPGGPGGPPGYGGPPAKSNKSTWALVCAIVGFCCGPVGIAGIILGNQAKQEAAAMGTQDSMANAAFIVGIISTVLWVVGMIFYYGG